MATMMGDMMSQTMENMGHEAIEHMMPVIMDNCFSAMDKERRAFVLTCCRSMLDQMEEKYVAAEIS